MLLIISLMNMAKDQVEVIHELGFESFSVVGHDRGARVAHRMSLDYPDKTYNRCEHFIIPIPLKRFAGRCLAKCTIIVQ